ncbi:MAG: hypothetical protein KAI47_24260, partial [Deltaproteobacteria bacterium]|nr:hypothetical protein [Deltaproteobacteria bacterium]
PRAPEPVPIDPRLDAECHPASLDLAALLTQGSGAYRRLVRGRALARASRPHLARNAALVAGNQRHAGAHDDRVEDALAKAETSERPELRDAAAWARRNT